MALADYESDSFLEMLGPMTEARLESAGILENEPLEANKKPSDSEH